MTDPSRYYRCYWYVALLKNMWPLQGSILKISMALLCATLAAETNANTGSIERFVSDLTGAPVPQTTAHAVAIGNGLERRTLTTIVRAYEFDSLEPGQMESRRRR